MSKEHEHTDNTNLPLSPEEAMDLFGDIVQDIELIEVGETDEDYDEKEHEDENGDIEVIRFYEGLTEPDQLFTPKISDKKLEKILEESEKIIDREIKRLKKLKFIGRSALTILSSLKASIWVYKTENQYYKNKIRVLEEILGSTIEQKDSNEETVKQTIQTAREVIEKIQLLIKENEEEIEKREKTYEEIIAKEQKKYVLGDLYEELGIDQYSTDSQRGNNQSSVVGHDEATPLREDRKNSFTPRRKRIQGKKRKTTVNLEPYASEDAWKEQGIYAQNKTTENSNEETQKTKRRHKKPMSVEKTSKESWLGQGGSFIEKINNSLNKLLDTYTDSNANYKNMVVEFLYWMGVPIPRTVICMVLMFGTDKNEEISNIIRRLDSRVLRVWKKEDKDRQVSPYEPIENKDAYDKLREYIDRAVCKGTIRKVMNEMERENIIIPLVLLVGDKKEKQKHYYLNREKPYVKFLTRVFEDRNEPIYLSDRLIAFSKAILTQTTDPLTYLYTMSKVMN